MPGPDHKAHLVTVTNSDHCVLRPSIQPEQCNLKFKMVFKWRGICVENITVVLPMGGLKIEK